MERQGSGLDKIIRGYEFEENYTESKKPKFYSDKTQFKVILPNLNYANLDNVPYNILKETSGLNKTELKIFNLL